MRTYCIHTMNPFLGLGGTSEWRPVLSSSGFAWHCRPADGARGRQNKRKKGYQILNNLYYWLKDGFCGVIQDTVAHTSVHNSNDSRTDKCVREDLPESDSCQLTSIVISTCSMTSTELPIRKKMPSMRVVYTQQYTCGCTGFTGKHRMIFTLSRTMEDLLPFKGILNVQESKF